jgi:quinol monooxygenase YgiN
VIAKFDVKEECVAEWKQIVDDVINNMSNEKTFISTSMCEHPTEPGKFMLFEVWEDREDFFTVQAHREYRHTLMARLPALLKSPVTFDEWTEIRAPFTVLNCIETLTYREGAQRGYHRDANWMVGLSFGCDVRMGFRRHDTDAPTEVTIPSGHAVLFHGGLHQHAVLGIVNDTAPAWWKYPFSRVVFLMRYLVSLFILFLLFFVFLLKEKIRKIK